MIMRILRHYNDVPDALKGAVVAIGNFDGVHRGHQALIAEARRQANDNKSPLAILAFEPHPQEFFRPSPDSIRLTPFRTKARLLAEQAADLMLALPFDAEMAGMSAPDFVDRVLVRGLAAKAVVVGGDFEFGKGRSGNLETLRATGERQGFTVTEFEMINEGADDPTAVSDKISSTRIRAALKGARPEEAAILLGRWWAIEARVEHGDARGRTMGFPTANMHLGHCLAPAFGVYAVRVTIMENDRPAGRYDGVANFGIRPMYVTQVPLMEAHLFDFDGDLYGKHLSVELIAYIRPEAKFSGLEALIVQIGEDAETARKNACHQSGCAALDALSRRC